MPVFLLLRGLGPIQLWQMLHRGKAEWAKVGTLVDYVETHLGKKMSAKWKHAAPMFVVKTCRLLSMRGADLSPRT
ncbi:hypothetical protein BXT90_02165 [Corynebacterium amycolatum]|nr:hypothetical protein BXT90_02165 [Corynebacterium amycolatum]